MIIKENSEITFSWFEAFNEHNIEKLLSLYNDDADHYSPRLKVHQPETNGIIKGKEALRKWWNDAFIRLPDLRYEIISIAINKEYVMMVYRRIASDEEDSEINEILNIKNGKICSSAVMESK